MKIFKIILLSILIGFITSCQNNNELNTESLKINVTLNTSIDLDNSNWLASFFKSFNINNINYVSKNNNDKIGINLNRIDVKKINSLNLEMFDGNGLRNTMGVYDNSNLVADLEKLNIRNIFTNANLLQYISNVPQKSYNESEYDGIINISSPLTESQIIKIITNKLSKNKNKCTVNFLVINNGKKTITKRPPELPNTKERNDNQVTNDLKIELNNPQQEKKANSDFYSKKGLQIKIDSDGKNIIWRNFGEITYTIEFIDYLSGKVCCSRYNYPTNSISVNQILTEFNCIKATNRYIIKITTNSGINRTQEKTDCCSIGFQSGHFAEDCQCDNACN